MIRSIHCVGNMSGSVEKVLKILIGGHGSGAHCLAVIAASRPNTHVMVMPKNALQTAKWKYALGDGHMTAIIQQKYGTSSNIISRPALITDTPSDAADADVIFIVSPAYNHSTILRTIHKYIQPHTVVVGLPGQPGFEMECLNILGDKAEHCVMLSFETLPWACRMTSYGNSVEINAFKETICVFMWKGKESLPYFPVLETLQDIFGHQSKIQIIQNHVLFNLMTKSMVHPPILYGRWRDWKGKPLEHKPLFYQGVDNVQTELLALVSDEIIETANAIQGRFSDIDISPVIHIHDWIQKCYGSEIMDAATLKTSLQTNHAYNGLTHPMKTVGDGFVPDFSHRYLKEDVPFGIVVLKGIAQIFSVPTPTIDAIILWGQTHLGKEFIVGKELKGMDLKYTRAPQSFGIHTVDGLMRLNRFGHPV